MNGKKLLGALALVLFLSGCTFGNTGGNNGNLGDDDFTGGYGGPGTTFTPEPSPSPDITDIPEESQGGNLDDHHIPDEILVAGEHFAKSFTSNLVNKNLSPAEWRESVIPYLYSESMQQLYSDLDASNVPFCTSVDEVELSAIGTFASIYTVYFKDSSSRLVIEVMDVSENFDGTDFKVLNMNNIMTDNGGC